ncbi:MAG: DEAD/DEAH box helicase [Candidatus Hadarchaeales archaeon]
MQEVENVFDLLARPIRKLLAERGFTEPTLPQKMAIPKILEGRNVLLISPSGSGKTESAFLPVLHGLLMTHGRERGIKAIYITPLRALNRDMLERLEGWCRALDLKVSVRHGDTSARERRSQALAPSDVVITTPESLQLFLLGKKLSSYLRTVRWVVVDEVHELVDSKRGAQLSLNLERLREISGDFQVIGLSATIGSPDEVARFLVGQGRGCEVVDVTFAKKMELDVVFPEPSRQDIVLSEKLYTFPAVAARLRRMRELIEAHRSTLVFTNTRPTAEALASRFRLWDIGFPVGVHHGSLSSFTRVRAESGLKSGGLRGMICTSSLELGIDVGRVDLVIQYNSPRQVTRLLQRVGRSGHRIGEVSRGVIIVQDPDDALEAIVIAAKARRGELEPVRSLETPLDVLLHASVSALLASRTAKMSDMLGIFRRAYPFRDLREDQLRAVLEFAQSLEKRLVRVRNGEFTRPASLERIYDYYFNNLSMIPELKQYLIVDDSKGEPVGVLDESFVAEYGEPGTRFVIGGGIWRIVQVYRNTVYVKPDDDPLGAIPTWIGEEIPVPFSVAQEVGRIRGRAAEMLKSGSSLKEASEILSREYGVSADTFNAALSDVEEQIREGLPVPADSLITVEAVRDACVLGACFGTLVNRTLARLLAHRISEDSGRAVATSVDPYRVILRSEGLEPDEVIGFLRKEALKKTDDELRAIVEGSRFFRWRLAQVARRMGVLDRDVEITSSVMDKLMRALKDTPAFEEAFKEVITKDLDIKSEVLSKIASGDISIVSLGTRDSPSPVSAVALQQRYASLEPTAPKRLRLLALASAKVRLLSEVRTFACLDCREFVREMTIGELEEGPRCPKCGSKRIGMSEHTEDEVRSALEMASAGRETGLAKDMAATSGLISSYGKAAAFVLSGRGITPASASKILAKERRITERLVELVVEQEREALFRRFGWK